MFLISFFFFNDTATTEIYTLSLHDALPIYRAAARPRAHAPGRLRSWRAAVSGRPRRARCRTAARRAYRPTRPRSEEHTSELQSLAYLVCRLLLEKKKQHAYQANRSRPHTTL